MNDPFRLDGKRAFVTGANTGIGQAIALGLANAGAAVIAAGRSSCDDTVSLIEQQGGQAEACAIDLSDPAKAADILKGIGDMDILVNNAGIIRRDDSVDYSETDWDDVMDVNLKAVFMMCQTFARAAIARKAGARIVNIASLLSFQGGIRVPAYTASKHGVAGLTKLFANEWSAHNINVNAVAPGYISTNNTQALRDDPKRSAEILSRIPAGRWGDPADIAGAVTFLCGGASNYVTGAVLNVDGGWLAR
ncbi:putative 2-deoxy-D-gluconate 3-dehydrogenase [Sulfitobacter noctilucicola]|uniref:2-deoxy-D-gluconate 3-dehydrogenase n=1 Tax=Sulfitobacter noctilucicola TaxID=1342301 RepID=A0A7W6Q1Z3_9RHOB|nr:2-dehydro-3-deoxy-D-gluconate 5-dehydrogenase KduD [Sulfitobacter noctilucicola]KIN62905.1 putative 2-deoxy-D-gluconate 3-dehydrogenase [Sulfitobacter noctilucicola]MBB4172565.1 2-deoxy-D-gluconate 3-dehydrogenase [Sulfitobacter noctilucicola]